MEIKKSQKSRQFFECKQCHYVSYRRQDFDSHLMTLKHERKLLETKKSPTIVDRKTYNCICCNYTTLKKKDFEKHENTSKHIKLIDPNNDNDMITCVICNKKFMNSSGLWKHKQKCKAVEREPIVDTNITSNMFIEFMKQSKDIQNFLYEQNKELQNTLLEKTNEFQFTVIDQNNKLIELTKNPSTVINTTNQQFNLQFFLNETCKDAMNINEFINSLNVTVEDFENTGKLGYIEGITQIILNGLKGVDTTKRPIHCTDVKRETVYIKSDDAWEKENQEKEKLKKVVKQVARMNLSQLPRWQRENPASEVLDTREHCQYMKYSLAALGGVGDKAEEQNIDKIMRNVMKEITIDKK